LKPGDVVVGLLPGAVETKIRPGGVIASEMYLAERPDVLVGILTTRQPSPAASSDYRLQDWQSAGLRAPSFFRAYLLTIHRSNLTVIGRLSQPDWAGVRQSVRNAIAF